MLEALVETEHDYQLRKIIWVAKELPLLKNYTTSVIMKLAGMNLAEMRSCLKFFLAMLTSLFL